MHIPFLSCVIATLSCATSIHAQYYPLTGVQTGKSQSGSRPARQNILDLQKDSAQFSLYIQALARMQAVGENDPSSWFQIAGIHGRPYIAWNNIQNTPGAPRTGYCTHNSVLFGTWHRPYLALYEQILAGHVQAIAKTYGPTLLPTYQAAADRFRVPYWDWGVNPNLPDIITRTTIQITAPAGLKTITNPLFSYTFQKFPLNPAYFSSSDSYVNYRSTARESTATVNGRLQTQNIQRRTWQSIARATSFNSFSTAAIQGVSIEAVHNGIHGAFGLHMSTLAQSAFDPVFWLHHVQIDRLVAIYQAINPTKYLEPLNEPSGTWTIRVGDIDRSTTPLTPFTSNAAGTFYTSDTSRAISTFGYTYPEISDWNQTPEQLRANVTARFNGLYNPTGTFTKRHSSAHAGKNLRRPGNTLRTWSIGMSVAKTDLNERFIVRLFIGSPPENPMDWFGSKEVVGSLFVTPAPVLAVGAGPVSLGVFAEGGEQNLVHDQVDIDQYLEARGINGQDVKAVDAYLKTALQWRVQTVDGVLIPTEKVPSLKIVVEEEMVTIAKHVTELPKYEKQVLHPGVTKGRVGGYEGGASG